MGERKMTKQLTISMDDHYLLADAVRPLYKAFKEQEPQSKYHKGAVGYRISSIVDSEKPVMEIFNILKEALKDETKIDKPFDSLYIKYRPIGPLITAK